MNDRAADDAWVNEALANAIVAEGPPAPEPAPATEPESVEPAHASAHGDTPGDLGDGTLEHGGADGDRPESGSEGDEPDRSHSLAKGILEWIVVLGGAIAVALLLRAFLFQAFWIPSQSMETALLERDRVLVNKISYQLHDVNRGDIVVFRRPDEQPSQIRDLIKRVIALEGETVEGRENVIYIDGQRLVEPYLQPTDRIADFGPVVVEPGHVFVMGDNRDESYDSRFFGTVSEERIIGRAFVIFWPLDRIGTL